MVRTEHLLNIVSHHIKRVEFLNRIIEQTLGLICGVPLGSHPTSLADHLPEFRWPHQLAMLGAS